MLIVRQDEILENIKLWKGCLKIARRLTTKVDTNSLNGNKLKIPFDNLPKETVDFIKKLRNKHGILVADQAINFYGIKIFNSVSDIEKICKCLSFIDTYNELVEMRPIKTRILSIIKCKKCGWCCTTCNPMLLEDDIKRILSHLDIDFDEFYEKYMDQNSEIAYLKLPCPFYNCQDKKCEIYNVRPRVCKEYPFNEFSLAIDPCSIGREIKSLVEAEVGIIKSASDELQEYVDNRDELINSFLKEKISNNLKVQFLSMPKPSLIAVYNLVRIHKDKFEGK